MLLQEAQEAPLSHTSHPTFIFSLRHCLEMMSTSFVEKNHEQVIKPNMMKVNVVRVTLFGFVKCKPTLHNHDATIFRETNIAYVPHMCQCFSSFLRPS